MLLFGYVSALSFWDLQGIFKVKFTGRVIDSSSSIYSVEVEGNNSSWAIGTLKNVTISAVNVSRIDTLVCVNGVGCYMIYRNISFTDLVSVKLGSFTVGNNASILVRDSSNILVNKYSTSFILTNSSSLVTYSINSVEVEGNNSSWAIGTLKNVTISAVNVSRIDIWICTEGGQCYWIYHNISFVSKIPINFFVIPNGTNAYIFVRKAGDNLVKKTSPLFLVTPREVSTPTFNSSSNYTLIDLIITGDEYCGDKICQAESGEDCITCADDCCVVEDCIPDWQNCVWGPCVEGFEYIVCEDVNLCGVYAGYPEESRDCLSQENYNEMGNGLDTGLWNEEEFLVNNLSNEESVVGDQLLEQKSNKSSNLLFIFVVTLIVSVIFVILIILIKSFNKYNGL